MLDRNRVKLTQLVGRTLLALRPLQQRGGGHLVVPAGTLVIFRGQRGATMEVQALSGTTVAGMFAAKLAVTDETAVALNLEPERFDIFGSKLGGIILHALANGENEDSFLSVIIQGGLKHGKVQERMSKVQLAPKEGDSPYRWFRVKCEAEHYRTTGELPGRKSKSA
jgi:hypothetical protein